MKILIFFILLIANATFAQNFPEVGSPPKEFNNYQGYSNMQRLNMSTDKINEILAEMKTMKADIEMLKEKCNSQAAAVAPKSP